MALCLSVEQQPLVSGTSALTPNEIRRTRDLLAANDPRKLADGEVRTVEISESDLDLALNYLLGRFGGAARVTTGTGSAAAMITAELPPNPLGNYLNLRAAIVQGSGLPQFVALQIGRIPVPAALADFMLRQALESCYRTSARHSAVTLIQSVSLAPGRVALTYRWDRGVVGQVRDDLFSAEDTLRLAEYHARLVTLVAAGDAPVALADMLRPLFALAAERSQRGDAAAENRALLLVVSGYVNGRDAASLISAAADWPRPAMRVVTLSGRGDLARHFMISASLAALGGNTISQAIGLFKEVDDSRGGTAFSFADLAADMAGSAFGEHASNGATAGVLQRRMAAVGVSAEFMPATEDLPEHLDEAEFKRRFGAIDAPRYATLVAEIGARINTLPIYR